MRILHTWIGRRAGHILLNAGFWWGMIIIIFSPLTRLMSTFLYKVTAYDVTTFVLGPLVFIIIGMLASYLPARRATQISPTEALRGSV